MKTTSFLLPFAMVGLLGCGDDNPTPPPVDNAGSSCSNAAQCYAGIDGGTLQGGAAECMSKVAGGYCTHKCTADSDCCAVPGECLTGHPQVCSPYENSTEKYCLLSCEDAEIAAAGSTDGNAYCSYWANTSFGCRSSGGGAQNRKVCMP